MKEKVYFIAFDGTYFDDKQECLKYELDRDYDSLLVKIEFYDENYTLLPICNVDTFKKREKQIHYIYFKNPKDSYSFYEFYNCLDSKERIEIISKGNLNFQYYTLMEDEFVPTVYAMKYLTEQLESCMQMIKGLD